jgi:hypothetical protein
LRHDVPRSPHITLLTVFPTRSSATSEAPDGETLLVLLNFSHDAQRLALSGLTQPLGQVRLKQRLGVQATERRSDQRRRSCRAALARR